MSDVHMEMGQLRGYRGEEWRGCEGDLDIALNAEIEVYNVDRASAAVAEVERRLASDDILQVDDEIEAYNRGDHFKVSLHVIASPVTEFSKAIALLEARLFNV